MTLQMRAMCPARVTSSTALKVGCVASLMKIFLIVYCVVCHVVIALHTLHYNITLCANVQEVMTICSCCCATDGSTGPASSDCSTDAASSLRRSSKGCAGDGLRHQCLAQCTAVQRDGFAAI